jgi:hypothetical protein
MCKDCFGCFGIGNAVVRCVYTFLAFFSFLAFLSLAVVSTAISSASLYTGSVAPLELPPDLAVYSCHTTQQTNDNKKRSVSAKQ